MPNETPTLSNPVLDEDLQTAKVNRQLWENSQLNGSSAHEDYHEADDRFYNSKDPNLAILHENPRHRLVVMLKAQGHSNRKIAGTVGLSESWVSQILRQPWARQLLVRELREAGRDAIQDLLAGAAEDSVLTLIALRDTATEESVRRGASNDLLDRFLGKPTQRVEQNAKVTVTSETVEQLDAELAELEAEEKRLIGKN